MHCLPWKEAALAKQTRKGIEFRFQNLHLAIFHTIFAESLRKQSIEAGPIATLREKQPEYLTRKIAHFRPPSYGRTSGNTTKIHGLEGKPTDQRFGFDTLYICTGLVVYRTVDAPCNYIPGLPVLDLHPYK